MFKKLGLATTFFFVMLFSSQPFVYAATYFSDEFDVVSTTTLSSRTPDIGISWSQLINNGRTLQVASYNDHVTTQSNGTNVGALYVANGSYPSADYQVSSVVTFSDGSNSYTRTLAARVQDANNMYILRYSHATMWIYKRVAGTWTLLNSGSADVNGDTSAKPYHGDTVALKVEGTTISGLLNGVEKVTVTDSSITAAGQAGLGTGYVNVSTDDSGTGVGIDNFLVKDLVDDTAPIVNTYSPADGATGVARNANLILTFDEVVDAEPVSALPADSNENDILIKKATDDSLVERIDSQDSKVSGSGTTTITINPDTTLDELISYYVQIGSDAFDDAAGNSFVGIGDKTTWNFTIGDFSGPGFSALSASAADTTATVIWNTDEAGSSQIEYGLTTNYGKATNETDTSPRVTSHNVGLSSLQSCRRYYYRAKSTDSSSNQATSSQGSFTTTGCAVTSITTGTESSLTTATGGEFEFSHNNSVAKLVVPDGFASNNADFQINKLITSGMPAAPTSKELVDENIFDLSAVDSTNANLTSFVKPITFTVTYGTNSESSFSESTLDVYKYNTTTGNWDKKNCTLDTAANTLTCSLSTFSIYAVFGESNSSNSTGSSSSNRSSSSSSNNLFCSDFIPTGKPNLFEIRTSDTTAEIFFTPVLGIDTYFVSFSEEPIAEAHGAELKLGSLGVQNYTVNYLNPNTNYYFKVRSHNGCMPGEWSNIMFAQTESNLENSLDTSGKNVRDETEGKTNYLNRRNDLSNDDSSHTKENQLEIGEAQKESDFSTNIDESNIKSNTNKETLLQQIFKKFVSWIK